MVLLQEKMMIVKVKNYVAAKIVNQQTITANELSMYCAAPELWLTAESGEELKYKNKIDTWGLGYVLLEILLAGKNGSNLALEELPRNINSSSGMRVKK